MNDSDWRREVSVARCPRSWACAEDRSDPIRQWVSEDRRSRAARSGAWAPKIRRQFGIDHLVGYVAVSTGSPAALVTGGSRGIGAATVVALARRGLDVAFTYRSRKRRADQVVAEASTSGRRVLAVASDMTDQDATARLVEQLGGWTERVDVLVTSHWAHLYGAVMQFPAYEAIARSKQAGELALRELAADDRRGLRLLVVTGDLVEGTITPKLLERASRGVAGRRRREVGALPSAADVAEAIATAALDASLPSGHTVVVGGPLDSLPRRC